MKLYRLGLILFAILCLREMAAVKTQNSKPVASLRLPFSSASAKKVRKPTGAKKADSALLDVGYSRNHVTIQISDRAGGVLVARLGMDDKFDDVFKDCCRQKQCQFCRFFFEGREIESCSTPRAFNACSSPPLVECETKLKLFLKQEDSDGNLLDSLGTDAGNVTLDTWAVFWESATPKHSELKDIRFKDFFGPCDAISIASAKDAVFATDLADTSKPAKGVSKWGAPLQTLATAVPDDIDDGKEDDDEDERGDIPVPEDEKDARISELVEQTALKSDRRKVVKPIKKGRDFTSSGRIGNEIRYLQSGKSPHLLIPRKAFIRALKDYLHSMQIEAASTTAVTELPKMDGTHRVQSTALDVRQCATEAFLVDVVSDANLLAIRDRGRMTLLSRDFALLRRLNRKPY
jgi:histone H3/H4